MPIWNYSLFFLKCSSLQSVIHLCFEKLTIYKSLAISQTCHREYGTQPELFKNFCNTLPRPFLHSLEIISLRFLCTRIGIIIKISVRNYRFANQCCVSKIEQIVYLIQRFTWLDYSMEDILFYFCNWDDVRFEWNSNLITRLCIQSIRATRIYNSSILLTIT